MRIFPVTVPSPSLENSVHFSKDDFFIYIPVLQYICYMDNALHSYGHRWLFLVTISSFILRGDFRRRYESGQLEYNLIKIISQTLK